MEAAYDQALYMPARISYTTEKLSLLVPMRVEMLMHAGNARTHQVKEPERNLLLVLVPRR